MHEHVSVLLGVGVYIIAYDVCTELNSVRLFVNLCIW